MVLWDAQPHASPVHIQPTDTHAGKAWKSIMCSTLEGRATTLSARAWAAAETQATEASIARRGVNDAAATAAQHFTTAASDSRSTVL